MEKQTDVTEHLLSEITSKPSSSRINDTFTVTPVEIRNIVVVGRSRCGKTSFVQLLKNPNHVAEVASLFANTRETTGTAICLYSNTIQKAFTLNIIDTPGFCDVGDLQEKKMSNDIICDLITESIFKDLRKLHCMCICVNGQAGGITAVEISAFQKFLKLFQGADAICCLVVTHSETMGDKGRMQFIGDLDKKKDLELLRRYCANRIFFTGAVTEDHEEEEAKLYRKKNS